MNYHTVARDLSIASKLAVVRFDTAQETAPSGAILISDEMFQKIRIEVVRAVPAVCRTAYHLRKFTLLELAHHTGYSFDVVREVIEACKERFELVVEGVSFKDGQIWRLTRSGADEVRKRLDADNCGKAAASSAHDPVDFINGFIDRIEEFSDTPASKAELITNARTFLHELRVQTEMISDVAVRRKKLEELDGVVERLSTRSSSNVDMLGNCVVPRDSEILIFDQRDIPDMIDTVADLNVAQLEAALKAVASKHIAKKR